MGGPSVINYPFPELLQINSGGGQISGSTYEAENFLFNKVLGLHLL